MLPVDVCTSRVGAQILTVRALLCVQPPFNDPARAQAGFGPEWYLPLTVKQDAVAGDSPSALEGTGLEQRAIIGCGAVPENLDDDAD